MVVTRRSKRKAPVGKKVSSKKVTKKTKNNEGLETAPATRKSKRKTATKSLRGKKASAKATKKFKASLPVDVLDGDSSDDVDMFQITQENISHVVATQAVADQKFKASVGAEVLDGDSSDDVSMFEVTQESISTQAGSSSSSNKRTTTKDGSSTTPVEEPAQSIRRRRTGRHSDAGALVDSVAPARSQKKSLPRRQKRSSVYTSKVEARAAPAVGFPASARAPSVVADLSSGGPGFLETVLTWNVFVSFTAAVYILAAAKYSPVFLQELEGSINEICAYAGQAPVLLSPVFFADVGALELLLLFVGLQVIAMWAVGKLLARHRNCLDLGGPTAMFVNSSFAFMVYIGLPGLAAQNTILLGSLSYAVAHAVVYGGGDSFPLFLRTLSQVAFLGWSTLVEQGPADKTLCQYLYFGYMLVLLVNLTFSLKTLLRVAGLSQMSLLAAYTARFMCLLGVPMFAFVHAHLELGPAVLSTMFIATDLFLFMLNEFPDNY
jgi:hypothetical protein